MNGQGEEANRAETAVHAHEDVWYNKRPCSSYWLRDSNGEDVPSGSGFRGAYSQPSIVLCELLVVHTVLLCVCTVLNCCTQLLFI